MLDYCECTLFIQNIYDMHLARDGNCFKSSRSPILVRFLYIFMHAYALTSILIPREHDSIICVNTDKASRQFNWKILKTQTKVAKSPIT